MNEDDLEDVARLKEHAEKAQQTFVRRIDMTAEQITKLTNHLEERTKFDVALPDDFDDTRHKVSKCVACLTNAARLVFYPCGHRTYCFRCHKCAFFNEGRVEKGLRLHSMICPVCRGTTTSMDSMVFGGPKTGEITPAIAELEDHEMKMLDYLETNPFPFCILYLGVS